jgi:hypothetical protein
MEGAPFSFHQKRSKLGTLLQTDANDTDMKKKNQILQISHTGGSTKKIGSLNSVLKIPTGPPPNLPRKGSQLSKIQCICPQSSKTVFMNIVKKFPLIEATLSAFFVLNTGSG